MQVKHFEKSISLSFHSAKGSSQHLKLKFCKPGFVSVFGLYTQHFAIFVFAIIVKKNTFPFLRFPFFIVLQYKSFLLGNNGRLMHYWSAPKKVSADGTGLKYRRVTVDFLGNVFSWGKKKMRGPVRPQSFRDVAETRWTVFISGGLSTACCTPQPVRICEGIFINSFSVCPHTSCQALGPLGWVTALLQQIKEPGK